MRPHPRWLRWILNDQDEVSAGTVLTIGLLVTFMVVLVAAVRWWTT